MKIATLMLMFALTSAYAQVGETDKPAVPASQEDVQGLQKELQRMRREAQTAERNAATRSNEERRKALEAQEESKAAIAATEKKLAEKLESIAREAQKASDDQLRTQRIVWSVIGVAGFIGILSIILVIRKDQSGLLVPSEPSKGQEILVDPDIPALKEFSVRNNGISKVPFVLTLKEGHRFNCVAELKSGLPPVVYFEGDRIPVAWDKRRLAASKHANLHVA